MTSSSCRQAQQGLHSMHTIKHHKHRVGVDLHSVPSARSRVRCDSHSSHCLSCSRLVPMVVTHRNPSPHAHARAAAPAPPTPHTRETNSGKGALSWSQGSPFDGGSRHCNLAAGGALLCGVLYDTPHRIQPAQRGVAYLQHARAQAQLQCAQVAHARDQALGLRASEQGTLKALRLAVGYIPCMGCSEGDTAADVT